MLLVPRPPLNKHWETFLDDVRKRNEGPPINGLSQSMHGKKNVRNILFSNLNILSLKNKLEPVVFGGMK